MKFNIVSKEVVILISVILGLIVLFAIGYAIYRAGKRDENPETIKIPKAITGDLAEEEIIGLRVLAINLFNDMDGWNLTGWNHSLYQEALLLDDRELLGLNNIFNTMYQPETGETLYQWLDSQYFGTAKREEQGVTALLIQRLRELQVV